MITPKVTSMDSMFYNAKVVSLDLSSFNTSNVTNMYYMF
ncbi:MAG: BspA family leucine-rich repeat surface protein [Bacilli bacterium]